MADAQLQSQPPVQLSDDVDIRAAQLAPRQLLPYHRCQNANAYHRAIDTLETPTGAIVGPAARPKVLGPTILILVAIVVIGLIFVAASGAIPIGIIGSLMAFCLVLMGVLYVLFLFAKPLIVVDRVRSQLVTRIANVQLGDPHNAVWYFVHGSQTRVPNSIWQLVLVSRQQNGTWIQRVVHAGDPLHLAFPKLVPFLRAPVYSVDLGWREVDSARLALQEPIGSPVYQQQVTPRSEQDVSAVKIERCWGKCLRCRYDLKGISVPTSCPECGLRFTQPR